ncbi:MAG: fibronectin type III domain-containing protein [Cyclobacteriaceae bacterium]
MITRWLLLGALVCAPLLSIHAQITDHYDSAFTYREVVDEICDDPNNMCHYNKEVSWNDSQIQEYTYRRLSGSNVTEFMNWRMVFPANYDPDRVEPYPVILMLHGGGESGRKWGGTTFLPTEDRFDNNGKNLIHGGQAHLNAVNRNPALSNAFPGIVIWPQVSYNGAWESGWENGNLSSNARMTIQILEWVIQRYNVDPDRVSMHGLSNGAKGSWDLAAKRPDLFAAILPMSGVGSNMEPMTDSLLTTPLWLFQGGTDTNPRQQAAEDWIARLLQKGGAPRYTLYPNLGHGVWNTAYAESDFWSWMLAQDKKNIFVFGGDPNICPGGSVKLGISANMTQYRWRKNGILISGATTRYLTVSEVGTYVAEFKRQFGPDEWVTSNEVVVGSKGASTFSPTLSNTGSVILPISNGGTPLGGVQNTVNLTASPGYATYYWFKGGAPMSPASTSTNTIQVSNNTGNAADAGIYTVKVLEGTGCISEPSNAVTVTWNNPQPTTPAIAAPTVPSTSSSPTEMLVTWVDHPSEVQYELWRFRFGYGTLGYPEQKPALIAILPSGTTSFLDKGLRPEALYKYNIRAILPSGGAVFSPQSGWGTTGEDNLAPTAPTNLIASDITDTETTLTWDSSSDNDLVYKYEIYNGSTLLKTVTGNIEGNPLPATTTTLTGLITGMNYFLSVRAVDFRNNYSPFAESIVVSTLAPSNGIAYKYYEYSGNMVGSGTNRLTEPDGPFDFDQEPTAEGTVGNFDISVRQQNDNFVFAFDGYIEIDQSGYTTFLDTF